MKSALFTLSLLANGALALLYGQRLWAHHASEGKPQKTVVSDPVALPPAYIFLDAKAWENLQSGTNADLVARLRVEGFPRDMIAAIIAFRLTEQFADRRAAILALKKPVDFWKYRKPNAYGPEAGLDAQARGKLRALNEEEAKLRRELLGPDLPSEEAAYRKRRYGDLPEDTIRMVEAINKDYRDLTMQARDDMQGILLPADSEKMKFLEKERRADLAAVMNPEQLADFNLRSGPTANQLQFKLNAFKPSESEYKQIYGLQTAFDDQYGTGDLTPDEAKRRNDAQPQFIDQIRAALGLDRFAEYQITTDSSYRGTQYFVNGSGLPPETTNQLVSIQRDITQKVAAVKSDATLTAEQRDAQLLTLSLQANTQLSTVLGAEALPRYKNSVGNWLTRIQPQPTRGTSR